MINSLRRLAACIVLLLALPLWAAEPVRIGVLSFPLKPWQPLAAELKRQIPERDFEIEILDHAALELAVNSRRLDFVLTNAGHYLLMQHRSGLSSPLATLINNDHGHRLSVFGGAIICRADRADINSLDDVRGKTVAYADTSAQGGYQMQAHELVLNGLNLSRDIHWLKVGLPHDLIVNAVLSGKADVGFVRAGQLETMQLSGKLNAADLRVLNLQDLSDFPWKVSTHLYPEWPFAALPHADEYLARRVTAVLLSLDRDPALVKSMQISGFTVPADYNMVEDMLWSLGLPPFDSTARFSFADVWKKYRWQFGATIVLLGLVSLLTVLLALSNRRVNNARESLAKSEKHYRLLIEHMRDVVWILDPLTLRFSYVSFSVEYLCGYTVEERMREPMDAGLSPGSAAALRQTIDERIALFLSGAAKSRAYVEEVEQPRKDGSSIWTEVVTRYYRNEETGQVEIHGVTRNISERKKAEDALRRSNADLERFAYSVSHDMRQPLRAISGHIQLLQRNLQNKLDEDERENMNFALDGARRMDSMIVSLLDYSRVGRKTEAKQKIASRAVLDEALGFLAPLIAETKAEVNLSGEWPEVFASRDEMIRLFQNLIGNAIKFRNMEQAALVEINSLAENDLWRVSVRDHGVGIDPQQIGRLFQFFSRLQARTRFEGTGMGLALCRRIVEHHNGRIWVESEGEGKGSTFMFELPLKVTEGEANV